MRCPWCGKDGAYLWSEDGITEFGDQEVQIRHACKTGDDPEQVASVMITVAQIGPIKVDNQK